MAPENQDPLTSIISTVSHELRGPLSNIREGIAQIHEGLHGPLTEDQRLVLDTNLKEIDRLSRYVNDLLDVARFTEGGHTLLWDRVDLEIVMRTAMQTFRPELARKNLVLREDYAPGLKEMYGDRDELLRLFLNIVGNAVKFTVTGQITVSLMTDGNSLHVSVSDTGIGISGEDLAHLFNRFGQFAPHTGLATKGSGLGLAISKGIVDRHGGGIRVESKVGIGTTVLVDLPVGSVQQVVSSTVKHWAKALASSESGFSLVLFHDKDGHHAAFPAERLVAFVRSKLRRRGDLALADGERVLTLLPATGKGNALVVAARICACAREQVKGTGENILQGLSTTVLSVPEDVATPQELLGRVFAEGQKDRSPRRFPE